MGQKDIISKSILKRILLDMAVYLFKLELVDAELLSTETQRIEDRRADLVARVTPIQGDPFILHLEIQNNNDPQMAVRMLRYLSDIFLAYPGYRIHQCLLYIGSERLRCLQMLEILADNRHFNVNIQETYDMLEINIERLPSYQKGLEKGEQIKAVEVAQKLLAMNFSPEQIAAITQLPLAEIETLKK